MLRKLRADPGQIVKENSDYKTHVSRQVYSTNEDEVESTLDGFESAWLEYKDSTHLICAPAYLREAPQDLPQPGLSESEAADLVEGKAWLNEYLHKDVEQSK